MAGSAAAIHDHIKAGDWGAAEGGLPELAERLAEVVSALQAPAREEPACLAS
jgi:hypothetical protein